MQQRNRYFLHEKYATPILAAANQLYEQNGRRDLPTLDSVRKLSRTNMADASAVMKEWRRLQTASASTAVVPVPDRVQHAAGTAIAALWTEAQELANESLNVAQAAWETERAEAEKQRVELSAAFDAQGAELDSLRTKVTELQDALVKAAAAATQERQDTQAQLAALTDAAHTATARAEEITKRAEDLKTALEEAQGALRSQTAEMTKEREQHIQVRARLEALTPEHATATAQVNQLTAELTAQRELTRTARAQLDALTPELATLKARADAQGAAQLDLSKRLKDAESQLAEARQSAAAAREDAAHLRGQAGTLEKQNAELMQALKLREGRGKSSP
jgi:chromosome segregation ATPase